MLVDSLHHVCQVSMGTHCLCAFYSLCLCSTLLAILVQNLLYVSCFALDHGRRLLWWLVLWFSQQIDAIVAEARILG